MHAIVESRPGDDAALYLLGNEQEVQETTEVLTNLVNAAQDPDQMDTFNASVMPAPDDCQVVTGEGASIAKNALDRDLREAYEEAYVSDQVGQVEMGFITPEEADAQVTKFSLILEDVVLLNHQGLESNVVIDQLEPRKNTIVSTAQPERIERFEGKFGSVDQFMPAKSASFETRFEHELVKSVGAVAFTRQFDITWTENNMPTLANVRPHLMLWKESGNEEVPYEPVATILSPDHPVRRPQQ